MKTGMLKKITNKYFAGLITILVVISFAATSCSQEGGYQGPPPTDPTDPSKPIIFSDFSPKEGSIRTLVFIEGSNFGTDLTKIEVEIGGVSAPVIGSTGSKICVMAPRRSRRGDVVVRIMDKSDKVVKEHQFEDLFILNEALQVNTLAGKVDPQTSTSSIIDGPFEEVEFQEPWWLEFDIDPETGDKIIYCMDQENMAALRKINLTTEEVSTVFMKGQSGTKSVKSMLFDTPTRDSLFFVDDHGRGNWNDRHALPALFYSLRSENFRKVYPYLYAQTSYSAVSMNDGSLFYNTYSNSVVYKAFHIFDQASQMWDGDPLFSIKSNSSGHTFMFRHPDDLYVYITGVFKAVYKCAYNKESKRLESPSVHVGSLTGGGGYADLPGTSARFGYPRQGVFVKNKDYVAEGKEDVYDFYVCDAENHCIRKVTPNGEVSTFAGRGSMSDGQVSGWIDGDARETARFLNPTGICYDEEEEVFYVADNKNKRIRTISVE